MVVRVAPAKSTGGGPVLSPSCVKNVRTCFSVAPLLYGVALLV
jgi:hypothetical protein